MKITILTFYFASCLSLIMAFQPQIKPGVQVRSLVTRKVEALHHRTLFLAVIPNDQEDQDPINRWSSRNMPSRRQSLQSLATIMLTSSPFLATPSSVVAVDDDEATSMFAPKFVQQYSDFVQAPDGSGYSFRDVTVGKDGGPAASTGDRVVYDWSGYTIGYFGRPFQAKGGPQGGAFDKDLDYSRAVLGSGGIVKGLEKAMVGMKPGGVRQVIVPYGDLSYPADDASHDRVGPKPSTFSGDRALNFVLENPRLDRTLLFNVKVIRVDKPDGKGGFIRG